MDQGHFHDHASRRQPDSRNSDVLPVYELRVEGSVQRIELAILEVGPTDGGFLFTSTLPRKERVVCKPGEYTLFRNSIALERFFWDGEFNGVLTPIGFNPQGWHDRCGDFPATLQFKGTRRVPLVTHRVLAEEPFPNIDREMDIYSILGSHPAETHGV